MFSVFIHTINSGYFSVCTVGTADVRGQKFVYAFLWSETDLIILHHLARKDRKHVHLTHYSTLLQEMRLSLFT